MNKCVPCQKRLHEVSNKFQEVSVISSMESLTSSTEVFNKFHEDSNEPSSSKKSLTSSIKSRNELQEVIKKLHEIYRTPRSLYRASRHKVSFTPLLQKSPMTELVPDSAGQIPISHASSTLITIRTLFVIFHIFNECSAYSSNTFPVYC